MGLKAEIGTYPNSATQVNKDLLEAEFHPKVELTLIRFPPSGATFVLDRSPSPLSEMGSGLISWKFGPSPSYPAVGPIRKHSALRTCAVGSPL